MFQRILIFIIVCIAIGASAQTTSTLSNERFSIINNDYREEGFRGALCLNNQIFIWIYASNRDRIALENEDISKNGEEKFRDIIKFYGNDLKIQIMDGNQKERVFTASTLTGRLFQMSDDFKMNLIKPDELECQVIHQNKTHNSDTIWKSIPTFNRDSVGYVLFSTQTGNNGYSGLKATIKLRFKSNKRIFSEIDLIKKDLKPYKVLDLNYTQGEQSYERTLLSKESYYNQADSLLEIYKKSGKPVNDETIAYKEGSKLIWFFGRLDKELPDSSLRFSLQENNKAWITREGISGHSLLLDNLKAGNHYTLKVWYDLQPENAVTYQLNLAPYWYQQTINKVLIALLIVGIITLLIRTLLKKQTRKNALKLQQAQHAFASVRSQLNPHFLFNALSSIQSLINTNKVTQANDYLSRFSKLLRTSLQPEYQGMVPLSVEADLLHQYINLEQLRMPFAFRINIDATIDTHATEIPGMLLQPLAENAIKHGFPGTDSPELICEIKQQNGDLIIVLKNNGNLVKDVYKKGVGLKLIEEKIEIINQCFPGTRAVFELTSLNNQTIASITLHQWLK